MIISVIFVWYKEAEGEGRWKGQRSLYVLTFTLFNFLLDFFQVRNKIALVVCALPSLTLAIWEGRKVWP